MIARGGYHTWQLPRMRVSWSGAPQYYCIVRDLRVYSDCWTPVIGEVLV